MGVQHAERRLAPPLPELWGRSRPAPDPGAPRRRQRQPRQLGDPEAGAVEQLRLGRQRLLDAAEALKKNNTPAGFALGNATGDSNWTFWLVWAHGGKMVDAVEGKTESILSPSTEKPIAQVPTGWW